MDISPKNVSASEDGLSVEVVWPDEHQSKYDLKFLANNSYWPPLNPEFGAKVHSGNGKLDKVPWNVKSLNENLPQVEYSKVMDTSSEDGIAEWCLKIWKYGFCFVNNTPVDPEATKNLIERIAFIRPTHYGGFWDFTSDLSTHDNAYSDVAIPLHIDNTYFTDPAGLQLFHLLKHDGEGGITTLCDSLHAANILKQENPEYYEILSKIPIPAHSAGEENVFIQPSHAKPIINHDNQGNVIQVRWNTSDRSVMNGLSFKNPETEVPLFYAAIKKWNDIIESKDNEFFYQLKPGQCLIFDNWRVFHSRRTSFTGERRMCGAYINHDDYVSRVKLLNLHRDDLLETL
ncbi:BA75_01411T0 [Komagataella pastoris]|uniref:BA75_01411T0 n=1 Tax=Komagataella pastoris TaxID=4922 RepID=A0A1B2J8T8_PICPA|nr:BA75_01411T0 [Komagataella pastoris]